MARVTAEERPPGAREGDFRGRLADPSIAAARRRGVASGAITLALALGLLLAIWLLARPLALLLAAIVLASALGPVAGRLERWLPRVPAILMVYVTLSLAGGAIGWMAVPGLIDQAEDIGANAPRLIEQGQGLIDRWAPTTRQYGPQALAAWISGGADVLVSLPLAVLSSALEIVVVIVMSIYWLVATPDLRRFALSLFPPPRREEAADILDEVCRTMGGYVRGVAIDGVIVGTVAYVGLSVIGVEYALVLALLAGLGELVAYIGPIIASLPAVAVALLASPTQALVVAGFYVVLQLVESYLVAPLVMRQQTHIPPVLVIFALMAGSSVDGVLGALVAIPLAGALRVLILRVGAPAVRRWSGATDVSTVRSGGVR